MKSIKEKAKAYDEAIKRAQAKMEEAKVFDYDDEQTAHTIRLTTTDIFPELAESEDERIRKGIIRNLEYLADRAEGFVKDELKERIAWLEKQGEQKPVIDMITPEESLGVDSDTYNKIVDECVYGEQNPVGWSEEDEEKLSLLLHTLHSIENYKFDTWLILLNDRIKFPTKQEWSEEDKTMLCYMEGHLEYLKNDKGYSSSEDQIMLKRQLDWLKSLRPQSTWKPSEEQMDALEDAIADVISSIQKNMLNSLYQDLQKLR